MPRNKNLPSRPSFILRIKASLVDYCLVLGYMGVLAASMGIVYLTAGEVPDWLSHGVTVAELLGFIVLVLPVGLYLYFCEASSRSATVGKRTMKLIVVSSKTLSRASRSQIAIRTIVKLFPWELAHFFVWHTVAITSKNQTIFPVWLEIGLMSSIALPLVYVLVVAIDLKGRGPHDMLAGTRVITSTQS